MTSPSQIIGMSLIGANTCGIGYLSWAIRGWTVKIDARLRYLEKNDGLYRGKD